MKKQKFEVVTKTIIGVKICTNKKGVLVEISSDENGRRHNGYNSPFFKVIMVSELKRQVFPARES